MNEIIDIIKGYENPYPKDIFCWDSKSDMKITRGRFNEFIHLIVENVRMDIIRLIKEEEEENLTKHNNGFTKVCPKCQSVNLHEVNKDGDVYCEDCRYIGKPSLEP